jgi:hypothetical protein
MGTKMKNRKNLVTLILAGFTGLTMLACNLGSAIKPPAPTADGNQPANQPQSTSAADVPPVAVQPPSLSADEVYKAVDAAMTKMISAGAHHVSQTSSRKGGPSSESDIVPPNQLHMVMSANGSVADEFYVVDGILYSHSQGAWTQKPGAGQAYIDAINGVPMEGMPETDRSNGKVAGVEMLLGKPTVVYSYDSTIKSLNITSSVSLWVDQASGLPVKQEITTSDGTKMDQVITYNSGITITLPADAKSAPAAP